MFGYCGVCGWRVWYSAGWSPTDHPLLCCGREMDCARSVHRRGCSSSSTRCVASCRLSLFCEILPCNALRSGRITDHPSRNHNVSVSIHEHNVPPPPTSLSPLVLELDVLFWGGRIHPKDGHGSRSPKAVPASRRVGTSAVVQAFPRFCAPRDGGCPGRGKVKRPLSYLVLVLPYLVLSYLI